jgi:hypothetical protein
MKKVNVFVDVEQKLLGAAKRLRLGSVEALVRLRGRDCHRFLGSSDGVDYAQAGTKKFQIIERFDGFASEPAMRIDSLPGTVLRLFGFDAWQQESLTVLVGEVRSNHIIGEGAR